MRACFIFNPTAGRVSRKTGLAPRLRDFLSARGRLDELRVTEGRGHATELARKAVDTGCDVVVAIGGDGTINEVAQAVLGSTVLLGVVPCGSGNGLAAHLAVPASAEAALRLAADGGGERAWIDVGLVNGIPFLNVMGLGLDAEVARRFNGLVRRGLPAYVREAIQAFRHRTFEEVVLDVDGVRLKETVLLLSIANTDQYGNGARIAPGARVDDGALDLVAVKPAGWLAAAPLALGLFTGRFDRSPLVRRWLGRQVVIERRAAGIIHTDGETRSTTARLDVSVLPRSLQVLVPRRTRFATGAAGSGLLPAVPNPLCQT